MQQQKYLLNFIFLLFGPSSISATCYSPSGAAMDPSYQACNGTAPASMCCHLGYSNNGGDMCGSGNSYGLCGITGDQLWRESCTDPTWKSPSCLKLCLTPDKGATSDIEITACNDGSYCCGSNNATCCDAGQGSHIVNNQVVLARPSSKTSTNTRAPTGSSTSSPASIPPTSNPQTVAPTATPSPAPTGLSSGAKAGIGIGAALGALAFLGGISFWAWRKRQSWKRNDRALAVEIGAHERRVQEKTPFVRDASELEAKVNPVEMPAEELRRGSLG